MTAAEAQQLWAVLAAAYWNPPPPAATRLLYLEELRELPDGPLAVAAVRALYRSERVFMPRIGEIRAAYWHEHKRARAEQEQVERRRALPAGPRQPIPPEVLAELERLFERLGIDVERLTRPVDEATAA